MRLDKKYNKVIPKYMKPENIHVSPSLNKARMDIGKYSIILVERGIPWWINKYLITNKTRISINGLDELFNTDDAELFIKKEGSWYFNDDKIKDETLIQYLDRNTYIGFVNKFEYNKYLIAIELVE